VLDVKSIEMLAALALAFLIAWHASLESTFACSVFHLKGA
jgi:hypothetical protein